MLKIINLLWNGEKMKQKDIFHDDENDRTIQEENFWIDNSLSEEEVLGEKTISLKNDFDNYFENSNPDKTIILDKRKEALAWIVKIEKNRVARKYRLMEGMTTIGRSSRCDIVLDSPEISEMHAKIIKEAKVYKIIDLGSLNGTFLNNKRINTAKTLKDNDEIIFANIKFIFKKI